MSKKPTGGYPKGGHEPSLSGTPAAFSHIKKIGPEYNRAGSGEREKAPLRHYAPRMQRDFSAAHRGPREELGSPSRHAIHTPSGKVVALVHSRLDQEKKARNQQKDNQMKHWRQAGATATRRFNALALQPIHLREQSTPRVFKQARQNALKQRLLQKQSNARDGNSR